MVTTDAGEQICLDMYQAIQTPLQDGTLQHCMHIHTRRAPMDHGRHPLLEVVHHLPEQIRLFSLLSAVGAPDQSLRQTSGHLSAVTCVRRLNRTSRFLYAVYDISGLQSRL